MIKRLQQHWPYHAPWWLAGFGAVMVCALASVIIGVINVWFTPVFLNEMLPRSHGLLWGVCLIVTGATVLVGGCTATWPIERIGLWGMIGAFLVFMAGIFTGLQPADRYVAIISLHAVIGSIVAMRIITTKAWRKHVQEDHELKTIEIWEDPYELARPPD